MEEIGFASAVEEVSGVINIVKKILRNGETGNLLTDTLLLLTLEGKIGIIVPTKEIGQLIEKEMKKERISTMSVGRRLSQSPLVTLLVSWFYILALPKSDKELYKVLSSQVG